MRAAGKKNPAVADAVGVHTTTVSKWRSGAQTPGDAELQRLAAALGVSAAWLRYGVEAEPSAPAARASGAGGVEAGEAAPVPDEGREALAAVLWAAERMNAEVGRIIRDARLGVGAGRLPWHDLAVGGAPSGELVGVAGAAGASGGGREATATPHAQPAADPAPSLSQRQAEAEIAEHEAALQRALGAAPRARPDSAAPAPEDAARDVPTAPAASDRPRRTRSRDEDPASREQRREQHPPAPSDRSRRRRQA